MEGLEFWSAEGQVVSQALQERQAYCEPGCIRRVPEVRPKHTIATKPNPARFHKKRHCGQQIKARRCVQSIWHIRPRCHTQVACGAPRGEHQDGAK